MPDPVATLCRLLAPPADPRTDGELLSAFRATRDEPALAELIRRHGPMVLAACRRLLPDPADAEDAFQAAFLVLVRRAGRFRSLPPVGPWLHRVAVLTARNLRRRNARRLARQSPLPESVPSPGTSPDLRIDLDAALLALPEKFRVPLVLCHLQGWTRRDAAERLGYPEGTLSSLLSRGLARLRRRWPGLDPAKVLIVPAAAVPAALAASTARAAAEVTVPRTVSRLVEGVVQMFWVKKATAATAALVVVFGLGLGVGVSVREVPRAGAAGDSPGVAADEPLTAPDTGLRAADDELAREIAAAKEVLARLDLERKKLDLDMQVLKLRAEEATAQFEQLLAKLGVLEAERKRALAAGQPTDDLDKQIAEAKVALRKLEVERAKLDAEMRVLQLRARELELQARRYQTQLDALEVRRQLQQRDLRANPPGPALEVRVGGDKAGWPCSVTEYGPGGKPVGTLTCDNTDILRVTLTRAAKDPAAPKDLRVVIQDGAPAERIKAVLQACKAAGFKEMKLTGVVTSSETRTVAQTVYQQQRVMVPRRYDEKPVAIDDVLKGLSPAKP